MSDKHSIAPGLGDGGMATVRFLRDEILSRFKSHSLAPLEDGAVVSNTGETLAVTSDSFIVDPCVFPGGDVGSLAVAGVVNDLIATGAEPRWMTVNLIVGQQCTQARLSLILDSLSRTANQCGVEVIAGDTKTLPATCGVEVIISATGIGKPLDAKNNYGLANAKAYDQLIITGTVAEHGLAVLSAREGLGFEQRILSDCTPLDKLILPLLRSTAGIRAMRDPTRGGLLGVAHDLAAATGLTIHIDRRLVPIRREVAFGCEMIGWDPLEVINEGKIVLVVEPIQTRSILAMLKSHPLGKNAAVIGALSESTQYGGQVQTRDDDCTRVHVRTDGQPIPRLC